jgi:hypothetical protein
MFFEDCPACAGLASQQRKCSCLGGTVVIVNRCKKCLYDSSNNLIKEDTEYINNLIKKSNRLGSSQHILAKTASTYQGAPSSGYRSMSDRISASIIKHHVPRKRTAHRPGASSAGGSTGVDVKHGSYARFLNKLRGKTFRKEKGFDKKCECIEDVVDNEPDGGASLFS